MSNLIGTPFSRRNFIERLGATGGVALAMAGMEALGFGIGSAHAAPPNLSGSAKGKKVVILGAGLAGMTAAHELGKAGYDCRVIEARSFAGGRCQTSRAGFSLTELGGQTQTNDFAEGQYINHGPWRIPYHHLSTLHYTKAFAIPLEVFVNDNDAAYMYYENGTGPLAGKRIRKGRMTADMRGHTAEILAKITRKGGLDDQMTPADRDAFIGYLISEGYLTWKDLDYVGTEGAGFEVLPGAGIDPGPGQLYTPFPFADVLHSKLWNQLSSVARFDMQRTMFQPAGGMDRIAKAFESRVGPRITYSAVVQQVRQSPEGVTVNYLDSAGHSGVANADYCICTIPLSVLKSIDMQVSPRFKQAMNGVSYAPVGKIGLQMKRRFWEEDHQIYGGHILTDIRGIGAISLPSTGWQGQRGVLLGYYHFGADAARISAKSPADRAAVALAAGQKIFPDYQDNYETSFSVAWHRVEHNLGGWAEWNADGRRDDYPILCEPDGRIYLSGEHLSYIGGWQAGAIESAWQQIAKLHRRVQA